MTGAPSKKCVNCNTTFSPQWRRSKDPEKAGWLCNKCYAKKYVHPKHNPRRIRTPDGTIRCKNNPRSGVCSKCRRQRRTGMYRKKPDAFDPVNDFRELCRSCALGKDFEDILIPLDTGAGAIMSSPTTIVTTLDPYGDDQT